MNEEMKNIYVDLTNNIIFLCTHYRHLVVSSSNLYFSDQLYDYGKPTYIFYVSPLVLYSVYMVIYVSLVALGNTTTCSGGCSSGRRETWRERKDNFK